MGLDPYSEIQLGVFFEISSKLRVKQRIIENTCFPYTLVVFSSKFGQKKFQTFTLENPRFKIRACSVQVFVLPYNNGYHKYTISG